jgi:4-hydroxy-3-methylbut-2-en-1-yl diphosphate synthase IspG/GcpE
VKKAVSGIDKPFDKAPPTTTFEGWQGRPVRIAIMGCIVNGPGEAADADLAVCAAKNKAFIYRKGKKIATVAESQIVPMLLRLLNNL